MAGKRWLTLAMSWENLPEAGMQQHVMPALQGQSVTGHLSVMEEGYMKTPTLNELLAGHPELLALPQVVDDLIFKIDDPTSSIEEIAERVAEDGALTARILRIINHSYYSLGAKIESVHQAIHLMGLTHLRDLVVATKAAEKFDHVSGELVDVESFWRNSMYAAGVARDIYQIMGLKRTNIFVATLLHHIGLMVMLEELPEQMAAILKQTREQNDDDLYQREMELLGFTHSEVGAELLSAWGMPEAFVEVTRHHHRFYTAPNYAAEAAVVHLADVMAHKAHPMVHMANHVIEEDTTAYRYLGFHHGRLQEIADLASRYLAQNAEAVAVA